MDFKTDKRIQLKLINERQSRKGGESYVWHLCWDVYIYIYMRSMWDPLSNMQTTGNVHQLFVADSKYRHRLSSGQTFFHGLEKVRFIRFNLSKTLNELMGGNIHFSSILCWYKHYIYSSSVHLIGNISTRSSLRDACFISFYSQISLLTVW